MKKIVLVMMVVLMFIGSVATASGLPGYLQGKTNDTAASYSILNLPGGTEEFYYNFDGTEKQYSDFLIIPKETTGIKLTFTATSPAHKLTLCVIEKESGNIIYSDILQSGFGYEQETYLGYTYLNKNCEYYIELKNPSEKSSSGKIIVSSDKGLYNSEEKIEKLKQYNIVNCYEDGGFYPENNITRAEFCKMVSIIAGISLDDKNETSSFFSDVSKEHWANPYIMFCYNHGLIQGVSKNLFEPDKYITYQDALKILVSVLGYEDIAKQRGDYPIGYVETAKKIGITNGDYITTDYITRESAAEIIYISLFTPMLIKKDISDDYGERTEYIIADGKNETLLQTLYIKYFK